MIEREDEGNDVNFFQSSLLPPFEPLRPDYCRQIDVRLQIRERKGLRERIFHVKATAQAQDGLACFCPGRATGIAHPAALFLHQLEIVFSTAYPLVEFRALLLDVEPDPGEAPDVAQKPFGNAIRAVPASQMHHSSILRIDAIMLFMGGSLREAPGRVNFCAFTVRSSVILFGCVLTLIDIFEISTIEISTIEISTIEISTSEISTIKISTFEVGIFEIGGYEIGIFENGTFEIGMS